MPVIKKTDSEIVYGRARGSLLAAVITSIVFLSMCVALLVMLWPNARWLQDRSPWEVVSRVSYPLFMLCAGFSIAGILLYNGGPEDLILDLTTRTYRFQRGFPLLAPWQTGAFADIAGLYVHEQKGKSTVLYWLTLAWKKPGRDGDIVRSDSPLARRKDFQFAMFRKQNEGLTEMQDLAARLNLPAEGIDPVRFGLSSEQRQKNQDRIVLSSFGGLLLIMLLFQGGDLIAQYQLDTQGQTTSGHITEKHYGKYDSMNVRYRANGKTFLRTDDVTEATLNQVSPGDPVNVTYLPAYPHTARTEYSNTRRRALVFVGVYSGMPFLVLLYYLVKRNWQPKPSL